MINNLPPTRIALAVCNLVLMLSSCGEKCEDTCVNGTCESRTATQSDCVCDAGYYAENCMSAANEALDVSYDDVLCGDDASITLRPSSNPLEFTVAGMGANTVTVTMEGETNTTADDIYAFCNLTIERQALSSGFTIESTDGFYDRDDFLQIDYNVLNSNDSVVSQCVLYYGF